MENLFQVSFTIINILAWFSSLPYIAASELDWLTASPDGHHQHKRSDGVAALLQCVFLEFCLCGACSTSLVKPKVFVCIIYDMNAVNECSHECMCVCVCARARVCVCVCVRERES